MAVPRVGGGLRSTSSGPSNQPLLRGSASSSESGSIPAYMDSTIAMADFTVLSLRDSMSMMNNEMRNLMVQLFCSGAGVTISCGFAEAVKT